MCYKYIMPSRNSRKIYAPQQYYHIYNRGVEKRKIFQDDEDYTVFLNLLKRHLDKSITKDKYGREYENYLGKVELLSFCLMPNHYHLLFYLGDDVTVLSNLIRRVTNSYSSYFNRKYHRVGHLFQDRYKASMILRDDYLVHISRYIHLNPSNFEVYQWSSLAYYYGQKNAAWVLPGKILELFSSSEEYSTFMRDYVSYKKELEDVKNELAAY